jgi:very-short-patch-repair endonuclease
MLRTPCELRRDATDAERRLWTALRDRRLNGCKFRRQHTIGGYIVDFACIEQRLIVEADGGQHQENVSDARRPAWLESQGWRVVRFWNNDILANTDGVLSAILQALRGGGPSPASLREAPSPASGRGAKSGRGSM